MEIHEQSSEISKEGESDTLDSIVSAAQEEEDDERRLITISYGRKKMSIEIRKKTEISGGKLVTTFIENIGSEDEKKENETTSLYLAAKIIIQKTADDSGQVLYYLFDTENNNLTKWAKGSGEEIFQWDHEDNMSTKTSQHTFSKIFYPVQKHEL